MGPHTIRLPSGDQVPAGLEIQEPMDRQSVPSALVTNLNAPGPPILCPIKVTSEPSGESESFGRLPHFIGRK